MVPALAEIAWVVGEPGLFGQLFSSPPLEMGIVERCEHDMQTHRSNKQTVHYTPFNDAWIFRDVLDYGSSLRVDLCYYCQHD